MAAMARRRSRRAVRRALSGGRPAIKSTTRFGHEVASADRWHLATAPDRGDRLYVRPQVAIGNGLEIGSQMPLESTGGRVDGHLTRAHSHRRTVGVAVHQGLQDLHQPQTGATGGGPDRRQGFGCAELDVIVVERRDTRRRDIGYVCGHLQPFQQSSHRTCCGTACSKVRYGIDSADYTKLYSDALDGATRCVDLSTYQSGVGRVLTVTPLKADDATEASRVVHRQCRSTWNGTAACVRSRSASIELLSVAGSLAMRDARGRQGGQRLTAHRDITECGVDGVQDVGGELDVGRGGVRTDLFGTRSAGDGRGDLGTTQHPGQRETGNADVRLRRRWE